jgi:outer membrane protein OmpA-like peptidoglycan-associated protein
VNPDFGLNNEVVNVIISGDKFDNKATVKLVKPGEADIIPADVKIISKKQLSCSFDLRGQAVGKWDLIVANRTRVTRKDKVATLVQAFTIQYPAPTVSVIEPDYGLNSEAMSANLTGTGFRAGAKVVLNKGNQSIEATDVTVVSSTRITSRFNLEKAESGTYDVIVINDDGKIGSLDGEFEIQYPEPILSEIGPNQGLTSETVTVNLTGAYFRAGAKVELRTGDQVIEAADVEVVSDTLITAVFDLTGAIPGIYDVIATNEDGKTGSFEGGYGIELPEPAVSETEPSQGLTSEKVTVSLAGTDFRAGAKVELRTGDQVIEATDVEVVSDILITAVFDLAGAVPGTYDVIVTNDDGKAGSLDGGFEIQYPEPILSEIGPNQGLTAETVTVNLTGTDFRAGAKVELKAGDQVIEATDVEVVSDILITAVFDLAGAVPGTYDVIVINDDGKAGSLDGGYEIGFPEPILSEIGPNQGPTAETVTVNLTGTDFRAGAKVELRTGDQVIEAADVEVVSGSLITAVFDLAGALPGIYDVIVTNDDGKTGSLDEGYEITIEPIDSFTPTEEPDAIVEDSDVTIEEPDAVVEDSDVTIEEPDAVVEDSDATTEEPDAVAEDSDATTEEPDAVAEDSDATIEEPDAVVEDSDVTTGEPDVTVQELNRQLKPIFFDFDRFEIRPDQIPAMEENAESLNENPNLYILLGGHTDERGSREYNLELSKKRAAAIQQFLLESGIDSSRISVYAYGEDHPVKKGHNESSWSFNRRVDILVWESPPTEEQGLINGVNPDGEED